MNPILTILGFNSALPRVGANPTAQLLEMANHLFLIDCGEGTQVQIRKSKARFSRIDHIFISHLHGDHVFGLPGLLSSLGLLGREKPMHIYAPKGIQEYIDMLFKITGMYQTYPIICHELDVTVSTIIYEDNKLEVISIPLSHRVPTNGYLFREKTKLRKIDSEAIKKYPIIDKLDFRKLQLGKNIQTTNGETIANSLLTLEPEPSYSYAFCSDTSYKPDIVEIIRNVDLLYHESTFLEKDMALATKTAHSTASEAAKIARESGAKELVLGHFSNRYGDFNLFLEEAKPIFPNTIIPSILQTIEIGN